MTPGILFQFGSDSIVESDGVATVRSSGVVDIRIVDDRKQRTLTSRMSVAEFAKIAQAVLSNVGNDLSNVQEERDLAANMEKDIDEFIEGWRV